MGGSVGNKISNVTKTSTTQTNKSLTPADAGQKIAGTHMDMLQTGLGLYDLKNSGFKPGETPQQKAQQVVDGMSLGSSMTNLASTIQTGGQFVSDTLKGGPMKYMSPTLLSNFAGRFNVAANGSNTLMNAWKTWGLMQNPQATNMNVVHGATSTLLSGASMMPNMLVSLPASMAQQLIGFPEVPSSSGNR